MNSYGLTSIHTKLDVVVGNDIIKLEKEINEMQEELNSLELYKNLEFKKKELEARKVRREIQMNLVLEYMQKNDIKKIENYKGYDIKLKSKDSIETVLVDIDLVPQEFLRFKKELDKKKASELYRNSGVLINGIEFKHKKNYNIEMTASGGRHGK